MLEDTVKDIRLFLEANTQFLPVEDDISCQELISKIVEKSNGSFLWVALVLKELDTHREQQIRDVLMHVPSEMDDRYSRILKSLEAVPKHQELAKANLRWTVCAARPLTLEELKEALRLDIGHDVHGLESVISSICGNLVYVNKEMRVQVVRQTVRSFLTREDLQSDFAINRRKGHSRLAEVCLMYLSGEEFHSSRNRKVSVMMWPVRRSIFAEYASLNFAEHLVDSSSAYL